VHLLQAWSGGSTYGGNVLASVGADGVLLVDTNYLAVSAQMRRALTSIVGAAPRVRIIITTHWHRDHAEGNKEFGHTATIVAHGRVRDRLSNRQTLFGQAIEPYPPYAQPTVTFEDSLSLHFNGEDIRVIHVPRAHTDGDVIVLFTRSNILHTGDVYIGPVFPFVDLEHGGTVDGINRGVKTILTLSKPDTTIVPGHRLVTDVQSLRAYDEMLTRSVAAITDEIRAGRTLPDIQQRGLPADFDKWQWEALPVSRWIEYVYRSLTDIAAPSPPRR
jgi:glyoxylase-like metal-dependent hydrolase (beta-lactamase superfamily II)